MNPEKAKNRSPVLDLIGCVIGTSIAYFWLVGFLCDLLFYDDKNQPFSEANKLIFFPKLFLIGVICVSFIVFVIQFFRYLASRLKQ